MATLYRKQGQSQVVDQQGNLQNFSGNLDTLPIYNKGVITTGQLSPVAPIKTVDTPVDSTNYAGITGGVADSIINEYTNLNTKLTSAQDTQDKSGQSIIDLMGTLTGKTADTQEANRLAGVDTETANLNKYAEQLAGLNAQATSLNREAQAIPLQVQEQFKNTGATNRGVAPIETGKLRENAIRALSIAQQSDIAAAAATGSQLRLNAAKEKAQQIVDLKYKPLEDALAIKKEQYLLNKDLLTSIDKKRTESLNIALKKEEQAIADKKELDTYKASAITTALGAGAPKDTIDAAEKAGSTLEVAKILGKYSPETLKYELLKEQIKTEKAQQSNIYSTIKARNAESSGSGGGKPPTEGQVASAGYADRIQQANTIIDEKTSTFAKLNYAQFKLLESKSQLANKLLSADQRQAAQAMRNFITAKLRKESGAAISPTEFDDARLQYFPSLGDDPQTLANKKALRDSVLNNLIVGSGNAYTPTVAPTAPNKFQQATGNVNQVIPGTGSVSGFNKDGTINFKLQ